MMIQLLPSETDIASLVALNTPGGGGGGTSILKVTGTCRWTGYDFAVINIGTGYLAALLRSSILAQGI